MKTWAGEGTSYSSSRLNPEKTVFLIQSLSEKWTRGHSCS